MKKSLLFFAAAVLSLFSILVPGADAAEEQWISYVNERFGYSIEYPDIFSDIQESDNGDGVWLSFETDKYALTLSGGYNVLEEDAESKLRNRLEEIPRIVPGSEKSGPGWYRVIHTIESGVDGTESFFYEYGIIDSENWATFILLYPSEERERFAAIAAKMEKTLQLSSSEGTESEGTDSKAFVPDDPFFMENGQVYKNETLLDCEVYEVPSGLDNDIKFWTVIGTGTSDVVTGEETGVWFFGEHGEYVTNIFLKNEKEYQDLLWSPAGDRLVLVRGIEGEQDLVFELYAEYMEKKAEFRGLRASLAWLEDGMRFVFTRIDDIREGVPPSDLPYGLKLSAVLYDSAIEETIPLKESTDTKNFSFDSVSEDGEHIALTETSVQSSKDWGEEEKIKEREIKVPMPAAG